MTNYANKNTRHSNTNIEDSVNSMKDAAYDAINESKDDLRLVANKAGRRVRDFITSTTDEVSHAKEAVASQIRHNPVQSSLIALGAGFILGALFRK